MAVYLFGKRPRLFTDRVLWLGRRVKWSLSRERHRDAKAIIFSTQCYSHEHEMVSKTELRVNFL